MAKTHLCDWCVEPKEVLHRVWSKLVCDDCLQKVADEVSLADSCGVVYYGDCYRAVCSCCKNPGPGAENPFEARKLALAEEFVEKDGSLVCMHGDCYMWPKNVTEASSMTCDDTAELNESHHVIVFPDGTKYEHHRDGSISLAYCDGRGTIIDPDGESYVVDSDGTKHLVLDDGTLEDLRCTPVVWFKEGRGQVN